MTSKALFALFAALTGLVTYPWLLRRQNSVAVYNQLNRHDLTASDNPNCIGR